MGVSSLGAGGGGLASKLTVSMGRFIESGRERREERGVKGLLALWACGRCAVFTVILQGSYTVEPVTKMSTQ